MESTVLRYAPDYWDTHLFLHNKRFPININSKEYRQIEYEVKRATRNNYLNIEWIERVQNTHDYGQLLLREQLLAVSNPTVNYYRVRRYITLQRNYLNTALEYNIDPRRCGLSSLIFSKYVNCSGDKVIIVVQVVTTDYNADYIEPKNSSDYFIDYIVET